jgi:predicted proteasome-type protease
LLIGGTVTSNIIIGVIFNITLIAIIAYIAVKGKVKTQEEEAYYIKISFSSGSKTRLILNKEQYEQIRAWLKQPDGIFEIYNEEECVILDRKYVESVEVKKK